MPVLLLNHLHLFQLCRSRKIGYKKLPCNFTARSQGGFLQVGGVIVHSPEKRASEGNSLSEYFLRKNNEKNYFVRFNTN